MREQRRSQTDDKKSQGDKDIPSVTKKNICSTCAKLGIPPPCKGHGSGGGGSSGSSEDEAGKNKSQKFSDHQTPLIYGAVFSMSFWSSTNSQDFTQQLQLNEQSNPEVIMDLLVRKLLLINNNPETGILTIKLQCDHNLLTKEQKYALNALIKAILNELSSFKNAHNIADQCSIFRTDDQGNIEFLRITLPTPKLYDIFTQRLIDNNLLPNPDPVALKTPFSTQLMPDKYSNNKSREEDITAKNSVMAVAEKSSYQDCSPFSLDALKPR
ncbi:hypothetical protein BH10PSE19_BH10PSE19_13590 [soil metagenome]